MPRREKTGNRLPWRYLYKNKPSGKYHIEIGGMLVKLETKDPTEAIARAKDARAGRRDFKADSGARAAADAVLSGLTGTGGATTPSNSSRS